MGNEIFKGLEIINKNKPKKHDPDWIRAEEKVIWAGSPDWITDEEEKREMRVLGWFSEDGYWKHPTKTVDIV